jgi:tripartite-type tricarboxylate transporter receptor subunit TctC
MPAITRGIALAATLALSLICPAQAQESAASYPSRQITMIVPFAPGGGTDMLARMIGRRIESAWGKSVVIENRPGAGGIVGATAAARAAPDGYTLFLGSGTNLAVNVSLYKKLSYDPAKDFTPLALVAGTPFILVVNPSLPVKTVAEFIAYVKDRPGQLSYATSGPGVPHHLFVELLSSMAGLKMTMVPYKGSLPALNDVAAGHVPLMMVDIGPALGTVRGGGVRALGISTAQRFPTLNEVPPIGETVPGFDAAGWFMVAAPAGLPPAIASKLHKDLDAFLGEKSTSEEIVRTGFLPLSNKPLPDLHKFIIDEIARWTEVVRKAGVEGAF